MCSSDLLGVLRPEVEHDDGLMAHRIVRLKSNVVRMETNHRYYSGVRRHLTTICCVLFAVGVTSCASRPFRVHPGGAAPGQALTPLALFPSRLAWSAPLGDAVPRGLPGLGGDRVYVSLDGTVVLATDVRSGATLWRSVVP